MRKYLDLQKKDRDLGEEFSVRKDWEVILVAIVLLVLTFIMIFYG
jgi:hypothetical protein